MFTKLFAESGLSLDRLKALLEVGAAGSIVKAANGDAVRQSQYSRQIKELEEFFRVKLIERQGKGTRLTSNGKELARISRFFMLGLSNFKRGCLAGEQTFKLGASATFIRHFLLPLLTTSQQGSPRYATAIACHEEIERGLHDLTLDFGVVGNAEISRPLQTISLGEWRLELWVPSALHATNASAAKALKQGQLPLVLARKELDASGVPSLMGYEANLICDNFLEARAAIEHHKFAAVLPSFLTIKDAPRRSIRVRIPILESHACRFYLAWNPRLLRLNPHAARVRDWLAEALSARMGV